MKKIGAINSKLFQYTRHFGAVLFLLLINTFCFAQRTNGEGANDNRVTTEFNYDTRETPWYLQPWIWALVAAFLILLIAWATKGTMKRNMEDDSETGTAH